MMAFRRAAAAALAALWGVVDVVGAAEAPNSSSSVSIEAASEDVTVAADGGYTDTTHSEVRASNEAGAMQASRVNILYDSESQQVEILEAHTLKPNGTKIPVDVSTIYEQLPQDNALTVTSFRVKTLLFPQFSAGDTAIYTARYTNPKAIFAGQFQFGKYFPRTVAFKGTRITITAPKTMKLRVENHDVSFTKQEQADTVIYSWRVTAPASKAPSQALVSALDREPHFFVSTFKDYSELGRAYAAQSEPKTTVTAKIKSLADQIAAKTTDRREQARLIYEWVVTHIRYVAIELGQGSFVPHDPDATLAKGYGDCKDHDVLLQSLLKAENIEAESILINSADDYTLTEAPSFVKLDHVITYLPEFDLYLDASSPVVPFGVLPMPEYGKPAVRASSKSAGTITMPLVKPGAASIHTTTIQKIDASGTMTGSTVTTATGPYSITLRLIGFGVQAMGGEKAAAMQLAARGLSDATGNLTEDPLTTPGDSYQIRGEFIAKGWQSTLKGGNLTMPGGLRVMVMSGDAIMGPLYGSDDISNEATVCISAKADEDISLEPPTGYSFRTVPDDIRITTPNLTFTTHWTLTGNKLTVHREFTSKIDQPLCSGAVRKQTADALKRIAHSYDENLQVIRSTEDYSKNLSQNPKDVDTLTSRGLAYEKAGEHEKAIADFDTALALKPNDSWILVNRGFSYYNMGKLDRALDDYSKVITLDDKNATAFSNRGLIYNDQGKYQLAIADFEKALSLEPDDALSLNGLGIAYRSNGQFDRAIEVLKKAIGLKPDFAMAHYNLAATYFVKKRDEQARAEYSKAIELDPGYYRSYWDRATIYEVTGKIDLALKDIDKAIELKADEAALWVQRANLHNDLHQPDAASADVAKALSLDPQSTGAVLARANIRLDSHQYALAVEDFTTVLAKEPNSLVSYASRASAYISLKDFKRAMADCDKAISLAPKAAGHYLMRAEVKHALGDHVGGNHDSAEAIKLDPKIAK